MLGAGRRRCVLLENSRTVRPLLSARPATAATTTARRRAVRRVRPAATCWKKRFGSESVACVLFEREWITKDIAAESDERGERGDA